MRTSTVALFLVAASCGGDSQFDPYGHIEQAATVCPKGAVLEGVDVSGYQPNTDWTKVKGAGISFAFIKATEGTGYTNPYFDRDWKQTKDNGIVHGPYHFFRANLDPVAQADYFVSVVNASGGIQNGDLPAVIDLETMDGQSGATVAANALTFLAEVEKKTGRTPIVYTYPAFVPGLSGTAGLAKYPLWIANYGVTCPDVPSPWTSWPVWQYADTASLPGFPAQQPDVDRFNGNMSDLMAFTNGAPSTQATPTQVTGNDGISLLNWTTDGHAELFAKTATGDMVHSYVQNGAWTQPAKLDGGATCGFAGGFWGAPWTYAELWSPLASGSTGHLWWTQGTGWNGFMDYGGAGKGLDHLATLTNTDGRVDVFGTDKSGDVLWNSWDLAKSNWTGWQSLGATGIATGVGAIVWGDGHAELFATDQAGDAWHDWWELSKGQWAGWTKIAGPGLSSRPVPLRFADGHVEAYARGLDGSLYRLAVENGAWKWSPLPTSTKTWGEPSVVWNPKGGGGGEGPELFVRDDAGRVSHLWWNGSSYTDLVPLGTLVATSDPFGWIMSDKKVEVFATDASGKLMHIGRDTSGTWGSWTSIGDGIDACGTAAPMMPSPDMAGPGPSPDMASAATDDAATPGTDGGPMLPRKPASPSGCGCHVGAHASPSPLGMLVVTVLLGLAALRRRRDT